VSTLTQRTLTIRTGSSYDLSESGAVALSLRERGVDPVRANFLTSTVLDHCVDLEAVLNTNGNRNHVDAWFTYMKRSNDCFGIGPRASDVFNNFFDADQRSYQASFYQDITGRLVPKT